MITPLSITISNLILFGIQFLLFLLMMGYFMLNGANIHPNMAIMLLPIFIVLMGIMGLGFGLLVSAMTTKYRDLQFLIRFGIQLLMYATPVICPMSSIPAKYHWILVANPMTLIIETFRYSFLGAGNFNWGALLYSAVFTIAIFFLGLVVFNRTEKNFMDTV